MRTTFMGGTRYFMTFIKDFSKNMWFYVLKSKEECYEKFKKFKTLVETQSGHKIKTFWLDSDGEFVSKAFNIFV